MLCEGRTGPVWVVAVALVLLVLAELDVPRPVATCDDVAVN